jgi:hypothetical protein
MVVVVASQTKLGSFYGGVRREMGMGRPNKGG